MKARLLLALLVPTIGFAGVAKYRSDIRQKEAERKALEQQLQEERQRAEKQEAAERIRAAVERDAAIKSAAREARRQQQVRAALMLQYDEEQRQKSEVTGRELARIGEIFRSQEALRNQQENDEARAYYLRQAIGNVQQAVNPYQSMPAYQPTQFHSSTTNCDPNYAGGIRCTTQGY